MGVLGLSAATRFFSLRSPPLRPSDPIAFSPSKTLFPFHVVVTQSLHQSKPSLLSKSSSDPIEFAPPTSPEDGLGGDGEIDELEMEIGPDDSESTEEGFEIEVEKVGKKNMRRIQSRIRVDADLETLWSVLTDYEGLANFIPSLAVSQLLDKKDKFAKLYQVGEQDLALGLKFNAKGVLDCYERDLEHFPSGRRRDVEFEMVEGDFQTFKGRWSIEQVDNEVYEDGDFLTKQEFQTTLSYVVELEPKLWLPVRLLERRLCKEVRNNLMCIREEAQRVQKLGSETLITS